MISALSVILPGIFLLARLGRVKVPSVRNLTIILASFAVLHGFYHIFGLAGLTDLAFVFDFVTSILLVMLGVYNARRVFGIGIFLIVFADMAGAMRNLVPIMLIVALILFVMLAIKSKSLSSLQTQLSVFLTIWIIAELLRALINIKVISATPALMFLGFEIHTVAMVAFGFFILFRFYLVALRTGSIPSDSAQNEGDRNGAKRDGRS